jgi:hypothetical protein
MYAGHSSIFNIVSTVTAPAASYLLTDLATVKQELNLVNPDGNRDAVLTRYIAVCSQIIQKYCNRNFPVETIQDQFFPRRDAPITPVIQGVDPLQLTRWPIVSIVSVVEWPLSLTPTTLIGGTDFLEDDRYGQLIRLDNFAFPKIWAAIPVTVQYKAGYATLPSDVVDACIEFVKWRYFSRMRDPGLKSQNIPGVYEASYLWNTGPGGPDDIPAPIAEKVSRYRVPVIG